MTTPKTPSGSRPKRRPPIKALGGGEPHPDYGGWRKFLEEHCEVRDTYQGVIWYGATNCNYILFPCGTLIQNFGYHGRVLMGEVRRRGPVRTLARLVQQHRERKESLSNLLSSLDRFTETLRKARRVKQRREEGSV